MATEFSHPNPVYVGDLSVVERQFLRPDQAEACRGAFVDLTNNYSLFANQPQKLADLGASLQADFSGLNISGFLDVGKQPLVEGVTASTPQTGGPSQTRQV